MPRTTRKHTLPYLLPALAPAAAYGAPAGAVPITCPCFVRARVLAPFGVDKAAVL